MKATEGLAVMLENILSISAAVIAVGGVLTWPVRAGLRWWARRRFRAAEEAAERRRAVSDFCAIALSAHGRVVFLGRLRASWIPVSEQTAARFAESLMRDTGPIASLRSRIRHSGDELVDRAADDVLHVLEESAEQLTKRKLAVRRMDWAAREATMAKALRALEELAERD